MSPNLSLRNHPFGWWIFRMRWWFTAIHSVTPNRYDKPNPMSYPFAFARATLACSVCIALAFASAAVAQSDLSVQVAELPAKSPAEQRKKAVLEVTLERVNRLRASGQATEAAAQAADVVAALPLPAEQLAARATSTAHIGALFPLRAPQGNPYIDWIKAGLGAELAREDDFLASDAYAKNAVGDTPTTLNGRLANTIDGLFWAYVHPDSPFVDNPEVLRRFLRRAHFYIDGMKTAADAVLSSGKGFLDEFAIGPLSAPLREFAQLYPGLLLPSQKKIWDVAMQRAAKAQVQDIGRFVGNYANIDTARGYQLLNFGLYLNDPDLLAKARQLMVVQKQNVRADGGVAYIRTQNAQQGYQYTVAKYLARYYEITRDPEILEILKSMEWYGPVSGRAGEWWTASNWKAMWNSGGQDVGGDFVAAVSGNPYIYQIRGDLSNFTVNKWRDARMSVAWFRNDVAPKSLPDNYTVIDRNIAGPRAWYGDFTYAATLRELDPSETGHGTLMGCMMADAQGRQRSIIPRFAPKVLIQNRGGMAWAWITANFHGASAIGRNFSVVSSTYAPATFGSSSKGVVADWTCRQLWLGLPDRLIGLLEITPDVEETQAYDVTSYIQLGVGGPPADITRPTPHSFMFGDFEIRAHEHNYRDLDLSGFNTRNERSFATELNWRSEPSTITPGKIPFIKRATGEDGRAPLVSTASQALKSYKRGQVFYNVVEVRTPTAKGNTMVKRVTTPEGLIGLGVRIEQKTYLIWMNPGDTPLTARLTAADNSSLHPSGAPDAAPIRPVPASVVIPPHQHVVVVASPDTDDHLAGWESFQAMTAARP